MTQKYSSKRSEFLRFNLYLRQVISEFCLFVIATPDKWILRHGKILGRSALPLAKASNKKNSFYHDIFTMIFNV